MDYKKLYEQAFSRAQELIINENGIVRVDRPLLEQIFPELTESEDERIRKEIIDLVRHSVNCMPADKFNERIAWLEKQGEQKASYTAIVETGDGGINSLVTRELPTNGCDEQKPAWSEEDELHIRELESLVKQVWATAERENDKDKIHKMSNLSFFLKTLKPQLKQEWSEEDEKMCQETIDWFEKKCFPYALESENPARESIKWVKSLKDRIK